MVSNLAEKLKACLNYLPLTEPDGVYLGDFLFYREKVNTFSPSYDEFFEFTPNTITYLVMFYLLIEL